VTITHAPGFRFTAQLLIGWLASRLNWQEIAGEQTAFTTAEGTRVTIVLSEQAGAPISECVIKATGATFRFGREEKSDFLHADIEFADGRKLSSLLPAGRDGSAELVNEELVRGGRNLVYLTAVAVAERLF
jgi:glucose-6-phosphate dehydrogenase assembly protein OpcA